MGIPIVAAYITKLILGVKSISKRIHLRLANILIPIYYGLTSSNPKYRLDVKKVVSDSDLIIVSLTSFPARINKVWIVIESMLRQSKKPDKIILWIANEEFPNTFLLPKRLLDCIDRGLEIRYVNDNLLSHNKYYYAFMTYPNSIIVTIDDDIIYPGNLIETLYSHYTINKNSIICNLSRRIVYKNSEFLPYVLWPIVNRYVENDRSLLFLGCGGVLYPPHSLHPEYRDVKALKSLALKADDLWLKIMSLKSKTNVVCFAGNLDRMIPVIIRNNRNLMDINIVEGGNDRVFKALVDYYNLSVEDFKN